MKRAPLICICIILTSLLTGTNIAGPSANPAAKYCLDMGYTYKIESTPKGDIGLCTMPDGAAIEAWKFFAGTEGTSYNYCTKGGYQTKTVSDDRCADSRECTVCILEKGDEALATDLMTGIEGKQNTTRLKSTGPIRIPAEKKDPDWPTITALAALSGVTLAGLIWIIRKRRRTVPDLQFQDISRAQQIRKEG